MSIICVTNTHEMNKPCVCLGILKGHFCITVFFFIEDANVCVVVTFLIEYVLGPLFL